MTHDPVQFVAMFFVGWAGFSRLLVLAALVLTVVNAARFLARRRSVALAAANAAPMLERDGPARMFRGAYPSLWWPMILLAAGFVVGTHFHSLLWIMAVSVLLAATVGLGLWSLRVAHGRRDCAEVDPVALAVLLTTGVLVLFGLLLTIRLVVAPDPDTRLAAGLSRQAGDDALRAVLLPAFALLAAVVALPVLGKLRIGQWLRRRPGSGPTRLHLLAVLGVFLLFAAPTFGNTLTFAGIATSEYGKIVYFVVLGSMLGEYAYQFRVESGNWRLHMFRARRHLWLPVCLFAAVGLASKLKNDFGPTIPMFVGTVATFVYLLRVQANRAPEVTGSEGRARNQARRRVALRYARPFRVPVLLLAAIGILVMVFTPYISERGVIWANTWDYNWSAPCEPPPAGAKAPDVPPGLQACQISFTAAEASDRSQVSQSLAVIADGGMWGRGLDDSTSGRVPAGATDFVLAVIWSKLGGITVLLLGAILVLLATALLRVGRQASGTDPPERAGQRAVEPARLYVVGFTAMILGQFLFVLAATVNALPHSGITAPFLSRGGQSTIALGFGVIAALAVSYRRAPSVTPAPATLAQRQALVAPPPPMALSGWWIRPRIPVTGLVFLICLTLVVGITVTPYNGLAENRPFCLQSSAIVDPKTCSTDRVAYDRTAVQLNLGGLPAFARSGSASGWIPVGTPDLSLADLGGLLDLGLTKTVDATSGTSLGERLGPPATAPALSTIELTMDPVVQKAAAAALTQDAIGPNGAIPHLPGGAVVLEAHTGRVLAAASGPATEPPSGPVDAQTRRTFAATHPFGPRGDDGKIDETRKCAQSDMDGNKCWRWAVEPPQPVAVNRALGWWYGLGSTFKVVVATAFLRLPGTNAQSLIAAPPSITVGGHEIRNANRSSCPRTTPQNMITLADALAVSCNTAFVRLAMDVGWDSVRQAAQDFGFTVGPAKQDAAGPAWVAGSPVGRDSRVPADAAGNLGNDALGGGDVVGTPLQMASVLATVADKGTLRQPLLVDAVTPARGGARLPTTGESRQVLTPEQAKELTDALAGTAAPGGTAASLKAPDGRQLWVKTGTHVQDVAAELPPGTPQRETAWLVGFLDTKAGRVAFAVAVETTDEAQGAARARWASEQIIASIVRARG